MLSVVQQDLESRRTEDQEVTLGQKVNGLSAKEGAKKLVYSSQYERDPSLRAEVIQIHGTKCLVCGFDFEAFYGELGKDYIEVHHLRPVSTLGGRQSVNPKSDMTVLCANCHRMIHRRRNHVLTPVQLRELIDNRAFDAGAK